MKADNTDQIVIKINVEAAVRISTPFAVDEVAKYKIYRIICIFVFDSQNIQHFVF